GARGAGATGARRVRSDRGAGDRRCGGGLLRGRTRGRRGDGGRRRRVRGERLGRGRGGGGVGPGARLLARVADDQPGPPEERDGRPGGGEPQPAAATVGEPGDHAARRLLERATRRGGHLDPGGEAAGGGRGQGLDEELVDLRRQAV